MNSARERPERDVLVLEGIVQRVERGDHFVVDCQAGSLRRTVLARRAGRLSLNRIQLIPGDRVQVEVSPYDLSRGRITYRL